MRSFRESVISGHSQQVQNLSAQLEKERSQSSALRRELEAAGADLRDFRDQAKDINRMEDMITTLKER